MIAQYPCNHFRCTGLVPLDYDVLQQHAASSARLSGHTGAARWLYRIVHLDHVYVWDMLVGAKEADYWLSLTEREAIPIAGTTTLTRNPFEQTAQPITTQIGDRR